MQFVYRQNNCNYNWIIVISFLFTKLPWPGDSEGTFQSLTNATWLKFFKQNSYHEILFLFIVRLRKKKKDSQT